MNDKTISIIRTGAPYAAAGAVLAVIDGRVGIGLTTLEVFLIQPVIAIVYYIVVRELEERWPAWGALLVVANPPTYSDDTETRSDRWEARLNATDSPDAGFGEVPDVPKPAG